MERAVSLRRDLDGTKVKMSNGQELQVLQLLSIVEDRCRIPTKNSYAFTAAVSATFPVPESERTRGEAR